MSLERKDVRAKLDPDVHADLVVIANADGIDIAELIERELVKLVSREVHRANVIADGTRHPGLVGRPREFSGKPKAGA